MFFFLIGWTQSCNIYLLVTNRKVKKSCNGQDSFQIQRLVALIANIDPTWNPKS